MVFALVAIVVGMRFLLNIYDAKRPAGSSLMPNLGIGRALEPFGKYVSVGLLALAILLPFIAGMTGTRERQIMDIAILMLTYIMLGWGLNIVVGLAGLLDLGYVAFYAVGAYSYALLSTVYLPQWFGDGIIPWAFFITLPIAGLLAALWGVILGFPGAAPARRLSCHRHAGIRRNHPRHPDQLGRFHRRSQRHQQHPAPVILWHPLHRWRGRLRRHLRV